MKKTVLITGAAKGLGKTITSKFAKEGYNIIFTYLNSEREAEELRTELKNKYGIEVTKVKLDVTNEEDVKELFNEINSLDVLVNNAAYNLDSEWQEKSISDFEKTLKTNIIGPYLMIKYAYPLLKITNGNIVNIASTNGIDTMYPESLDYDASKSALINMTKNLAAPLAPDVRINAVAPGWIENENEDFINPILKEKELEKIAMNRFAKEEEIADVVVFLASSKASYMTGSIVRVDGGSK